MHQKYLDFFLGANSPEGFYSLYESARKEKEYDTFLIKGGPGTGKSSFMKKVLENQNDAIIERVHCSSDPDSLDGIILHDKNIIMLDATPPHALEPQYPGAVESSVNINECWDEKALKTRRAQIVATSDENAKLHARARRFLKVFYTLCLDNTALMSEGIDYQKLALFCTRFCDKIIPKQKGKGKKYERILSAVTPKGVVFYQNTVDALCEQVFVIKDEFSLCAEDILKKVEKTALERGFDVYSCYCPISSGKKLEHLIIPSLKLGIVTQNRYHAYSGDNQRVISYTRFADAGKLKEKKSKVSWNKRCAAELLTQAVRTLSLAKQNHDKLEALYTPSVDFNKVNLLCEKVTVRING
ncbi:MAG: hypothetical protein IKV58_02755 [Oscillospiraceae bacterium]|nr:hypothetical protein [Oscillospiraceae bacterium]